MSMLLRSVRKKKGATEAPIEDDDAKVKRASKMEVKLLSGQTVFYAVSSSLLGSSEQNQRTDFGV